MIVGAGIGGLLSALALAKERKKVLVLEKANVIGGNCRSYNVDGFQVDTGPHAITWLKKGPLVDLMNQYFDVIPKFMPHGNYYVRDEGKLLKFPYTLQSLARFSAFTRRDRILMARAFIDAAKSHTIGKKKLDKSVYEVIKDYKLSDKAQRFIDTLCYFLSGRSMKETPVWRVLSGGGATNELSSGIKEKISGIVGVIRNRHESHQGYPIGGIKSITNAILISLPEKRATIKTGEAVLKIKREGKRFSVKTKSAVYHSDVIVFSGYVKNLPKILENKLPKDFNDSLLSLKQSHAMILWLGLNKKRKEFNYTGSEIWFNEKTPYWAMPISNYDPQLAPKGMQLIGFSSKIPDGEPSERHMERLLETIKKAIPGIENDIVMQHTQVTVPEKAAITIGAKFPGPKTPIKGLYLSGTDVDQRSMGITRAAYSVVEMLKKMKEDKII